MFRRYADTNTPGGVQVIKSKKDLGTDHSRHITARSIAEYGVEPRPGFLLTRVRAISSRVNQNFDGFPSEELKKAYKSFVGRPVFVNHSNHDPSRARGRVVASQYFEDGNDKYIELVMEVDAKNYPKLAAEIEAGRIDSVSMGCDVQESICSYCGNVAKTGADFCDHILHSKGQLLPRESSNGEYEDVLVYEECRGLNFFEISYVFDPADETAVMSEVIRTSSLKKAASKKTGYGEVVAPAPVDTLREESVCPQCGDDSFDEVECLFCGYTAPPKMLQDPDVDRAKREDFRMVREEQNPTRQTSRKEDTEMAKSLQEAVRRRRVSEAGSRLRRLQAGDLSQPEESITQTPAPQTAPVTTEEVRNEEDTTDVEDLNDTVAENPEADEKADVTKLERRRTRARKSSLRKRTFDLYDDEEEVCEDCGSPVEEPGNTLCDRCNEEYEREEDRKAFGRKKRAGDLAEGGPGGQDGEGAETGSNMEAAEPDATTDVEVPIETSDEESESSQYNETGWDDNASNETGDPGVSTDLDGWKNSRRRRRARRRSAGLETWEQDRSAYGEVLYFKGDWVIAQNDEDMTGEPGDFWVVQDENTGAYGEYPTAEAAAAAADAGQVTAKNSRRRRARRRRSAGLETWQQDRSAYGELLYFKGDWVIAQNDEDMTGEPGDFWVVQDENTGAYGEYPTAEAAAAAADAGQVTAKRDSRLAKTTSIQAMRLTDLYIQAGLVKNDDKYTKMAEFEKLPAVIVDDRIALLQLVSKNMQTRTASAVASRRSPVGRMPSMSSRPTTMKQSSNEDGGDTLLLV